MSKITLENYIKERDIFVKEIINKARFQSAALKSGIIPHNHPHLISTLIPNLENEAFVERKIKLYQGIFDKIFVKNARKKDKQVASELIQPSNSQKRLLLLASTYSNASSRLVEKLFNGDSSLPKALRKEFKKVNNGHAVMVSHERIMEQLPEYSEAFNMGHLYSSHIVYGEVKAIADSVIKLSKKFGYNIIDLSSSHSQEKNEDELNKLKNSNSKSKKDSAYELISVGLVGEIDNFSLEPQKHDKNSSYSYIRNLIKKGLKNLAQPGSFPFLMKASKHALLLWDNGKM